MGPLSLAQQIAELEVAAPTEFDAEETLEKPSAHSSDIEDVDASAARDHYVDVGPSSFRRALDHVYDAKYSGVKVFRSQMYDDSDSNEINDEEGLEDQPRRHLQETEEISSGSAENASQADRGHLDHAAEQEEIDSTMRRTRQTDRIKGKAIVRQKDIWDSLLDARIRLQKAAVAMNKLPAGIHTEPETVSILHQIALLSEDLFELHENLLDSTPAPPRKHRKIESEDSSSQDLQDRMQEAMQDSAAFEHALHPYVVSTLSKWSAKIQAVAPSLLLPSNKHTFSKGNQRQKSVLQLIDDNLLDHGKLLARTQTWRDENSPEAPDASRDIFDDSDFYQQLLRDVIDSHAAGQDDWMMVQKQKKAKKKVDTRASKGRKIRYEVHEKLQNFMVPVPAIGGWQDEQIDELFSSLLGKGFEDALGVEPAPDVELDEGASGFRVF